MEEEEEEEEEEEDCWPVCRCRIQCVECVRCVCEREPASERPNSE